MNVKELDEINKKVSEITALERVTRSALGIAENGGYVEVAVRSEKGYARNAIALKEENAQKITAVLEKFLVDMKAEVEEKYDVTF